VKQLEPGNGAGADPATVEAWRELVAEQRETIRDLRARLDAEAEERRRQAEERRQLQAMLTDRRPWWRRWFR
jgi:hypothetical protein